MKIVAAQQKKLQYVGIVKSGSNCPLQLKIQYPVGGPHKGGLLLSIPLDDVHLRHGKEPVAQAYTTKRS